MALAQNECRFVVEPSIFRDIGAEISGWNTNGHYWIRQFCWMFGATPLKCSLLYEKLIEHGYSMNDVDPRDMMFGLLLARTYGTEEMLASLCNTTAKRSGTKLGMHY